MQLIDFKPDVWVDFETPTMIVETIVTLCKKANIVAIAMDLGAGVWLYESLGKRLLEENLSVALKGVAFNSSPTQERTRDGVDLASGDANSAEMAVNKRAELHLDLRELMETKSIKFAEEVIQKIDPEMQAVGREIEGNRGKVQIEDKTRFIKKRLGHSPDSLDAVMLAVHAFILYRLGLLNNLRSLGLYNR